MVKLRRGTAATVRTTTVSAEIRSLRDVRMALLMGLGLRGLGSSQSICSPSLNRVGVQCGGVDLDEDMCADLDVGTQFGDRRAESRMQDTESDGRLLGRIGGG